LQAHKSLTQSQPAKECAFFPRLAGSKRVTEKPRPLTKVLLQLGLDERTIISSAYPSFGFGGRNSTRH